MCGKNEKMASLCHGDDILKQYFACVSFYCVNTIPSINKTDTMYSISQKIYQRYRDNKTRLNILFMLTEKDSQVNIVNLKKQLKLSSNVVRLILQIAYTYHMQTTMISKLVCQSKSFYLL